jgi:hypothetical protein
VVIPKGNQVNIPELINDALGDDLIRIKTVKYYARESFLFSLMNIRWDDLAKGTL